MGKPIVYIIPGFKHSPQKKEYQVIADLFKAKNFDVVLVAIDWKYKTVSQWVEQFLTKYYKNENRKKYFFGFSYGAVISFVASTKVDVEGQILCSLSPYFNEDLAGLFKSWKRMIGKRRIEHFKELKMADLAPLVKAETFLLYGTHEGKFIELRAKDTYEKLKCKKSLIAVLGSKHDIGNSEYVKQIEKVISSF
jgi:hypothetical protein